MGFLKDKKELTELEKIKISIKKNPYLSKENKDFLLNVDPEMYNFNSEENFINVIKTIISNKNLCERDMEKTLNEVLEIYRIFELYDYRFNQFLLLFMPNGIYERNIFSTEILSHFERIENYYLAMNLLIKHDITLKNFQETTRLISALGIYTTNDIELNSMLSHFLTTANFMENYSDNVDYAIETAKRRAGVYDNLSDDYLAKMEMLVNKSVATVDTYKKEEAKIKALNENLRSLRLEVQKVIKAFDERILGIDEEFRKISNKHQGDIDDKYLELYVKLQEDFGVLIDKLDEKANNEAKKAALAAVARLEESAKNLSNLETQYKTKTKSEIEGLESIRQVATEEVEKGLKEIKSIVSRLNVDESVDLSKLSTLLKTDANIVVPSQSIILPNQEGIVSNESIDESKLPEILPCFQDSIIFQNRFKMLLDRKAKLESEGEVYNEAIDDCIYFILRNFYPYLYGPSGAGKNYFVKQLGKLFDLPVMNIGYITEEHDIVGGKTAHGGYSPSNFYNCWLNGYIGFANELDNSVAQAAIKLGEFLDAEVGEEYIFPGLRYVKRHPNCRIIAAGNTAGMGANRAYNARQKFDESIQQRFKYVKFDFDEKVEKSILEGHEEWYEFAMLFRQAINNYYQFKQDEVEGQITTRDLRDLKTEIEDGILTTEKILCYEFIEAKKSDCLANIISYMNDNTKDASTKAKTLVKTFEKTVHEMHPEVRKNG
ncbi:MAG: hypothetical protein OSJ70_03245 [Bacilli bacterium]|nr:hypothetical protein [Bacilli bacterium]